MNTTYQTLIVKFSEPITALDGIFDDTGAWGTDTLKGWIDDYESTRFTATDSHTAVKIRFSSLFYYVIVKTCSDIFYTIGQKKCPMLSAKIRNYSHSHNLMSK